MSPFTLRLDADLERFTVTPRTGASRRDILEALISAAETTPVLGGWDCVADLRNPMTGAFEFDLRALVPLFDIETERPPVTVLVSTAERTAHWARILNHQFRARRFHVASTPAGAVQHLAADRSRYDRRVA